MSEDQLAAEIEASLNRIPFDSPGDLELRASGHGLTGLGSWLFTFQNGIHDCARCDEPCVPPPDAALTCSPETYLRVARREGGWNAEIACLQGLFTIAGDEALARTPDTGRTCMPNVCSRRV